MSTRCHIAKKINEEEAEYIYCHFDGSHITAKFLHDNYRDEKKVDQLLNLGDISSLGHDTYHTIAYFRDRGETLNPKGIRTIADLKQDQEVDCYHLFNPQTNEWTWGFTC
ncbi:MAG: hypothetical protein ACO3L1_06990 [Flavobacteriaceae bacterium]